MNRPSDWSYQRERYQYKLKLLSLHEGMLNPAQTEMIRQLRSGILALAVRESTSQDVKVPTFND
jgi:hypothetical protein